MLYNEENRNGRWYDSRPMESDETDGWYDAAPQNAPAQAAAPQSAQASQTPPPQGVPPTPPPHTPQTPPPYGPNGFAPPVYPAQTPPWMPEPMGKTKKVASFWRTLAIVCLCLLVVAVGVLRLFATQWSISVSDGTSDSGSRRSAADDDASDYSSYYRSDYDDDMDIYEYFDSYFVSSSDIDIPTAPTGTGVTLPLENTTGKELSLQGIYEKVSPTVVGITCYRNGEEWSWGTGVVFTADGYIVTNAHVLEGSNAADVVFTDGSTLTARFVGSDTATDLAVLKVKAEGLTYAAFADSATCQVGDEVVAIGNPLGEQYAGTMTNGIISAINRSVSNNGFTMTLLQTNAALNEGNSGGPLINMHGQVIGITNMKVMFTYSATVEGIGFAIPTSVIQPVVDAIIENGYVPGQPTLGIVAGSVSDEARERYDLPAGIYVSNVDENSDAWAQGLREGDVITKVNGEKVLSVDDVNAIKTGLSVGDEITCTVYREGDTFDITFQLVDKGVIG